MPTSRTTRCGRGDRAVTLSPAHSEDEAKRRDRNRYYALLEDELERVELSEPEACLLMDALNGTLLDATSYGSLWMHVADACSVDSLHLKWDVDRQELVAKLQNLTPGQMMAVVDATEQFWRCVSDTELSTSERLKKVGLLKSETAGR